MQRGSVLLARPRPVAVACGVAWRLGGWRCLASGAGERGEVPSNVRYNRDRREVLLAYEDGRASRLSAEYLRVFSPDVSNLSMTGGGSTAAPAPVVHGKRGVSVTGIEPVGSYALRFVFSDGHESGIYSWTFLEDLEREKVSNMRRYIRRLRDEGRQRTPTVVPGKEEVLEKLRAQLNSTST